MLLVGLHIFPLEFSLRLVITPTVWLNIVYENSTNPQLAMDRDILFRKQLFCNEDSEV